MTEIALRPREQVGQARPALELYVNKLMKLHQVPKKFASRRTPQVVTLIVDDSDSMDGTTAAQATEAIKNLVIQMQVHNHGSSGFRFLLNIAKFGSITTGLAEGAKPTEIDVDQISFNADSGTSDIPKALIWATDAVQKSLEACRQTIKSYNEECSPNPLVVFLIGGARGGGSVVGPANALKLIPFAGGRVDVMAIGFCISAWEFLVVKTIASRPDLAINMDSAQSYWNKVTDQIAERPNSLLPMIATLQRNGEGSENGISKIDI